MVVPENICDKAGEDSFTCDRAILAYHEACVERSPEKDFGRFNCDGAGNSFGEPYPIFLEGVW